VLLSPAAHWDKSEGTVMSVEVGPAVVSVDSGWKVGWGPRGAYVSRQISVGGGGEWGDS
jgi:hypothetical protein